MAEGDNDEDDTDGVVTVEATGEMTKRDWLSLGMLIVTYVICLVFGVCGKADAMKVMAAFGAVSVALINLDRFSEISGLGFKAKMARRVQKVENVVNEVVDKLSEREQKTNKVQPATQTSGELQSGFAVYTVGAE